MIQPEKNTADEFVTPSAKIQMPGLNLVLVDGKSKQHPIKGKIQVLLVKHILQLHGPLLNHSSVAAPGRCGLGPHGKSNEQ